MSKHTQGPWKTKKDHIVQDGTSHPIAMVFNQFSSGEYNKSEVDSNSQLMAAAPEMLDALEQSVELLNEYLDKLTGAKDAPNYESIVKMREIGVLKKQIEAIKRAKGEI